MVGARGARLTGLVAAAVLLAPELRRWARERRERHAAFVATRGPTVDEATRIDEPDETEVVQRALDAASAPLRDPADPRAAVIEAYVRMEQVLAERDLGRRAPEAPREYLTRVLCEHGVPQRSLATITALFEEARFSRHPISQSAGHHALSELETPAPPSPQWKCGTEQSRTRSDPSLKKARGPRSPAAAARPVSLRVRLSHASCKCVSVLWVSVLWVSVDVEGSASQRD